MLPRYRNASDETLECVRDAAAKAMRTQYSRSLARVVRDYSDELWRRHPQPEFEPITLDGANADMPAFIQTVFEGICPQCGRLADNVESYGLPAVDGKAITWQHLTGCRVTCREGHVSVVEPNEFRSDYVAWIE